MIDTIYPFRHQNCLLLIRHRFRVLTHYIIQSGDHAQTLRNLRMHSTVDVVQQSQSFAYQFVTLLEVPLMDFSLPRRIEIVSVRGPRIDVLHHREDIENVLLVENHFALRIEIVVSKKDLNAGFDAERSEQGDFLQEISFDGGIDIGGLKVVIEVRFQI